MKQSIIRIFLFNLIALNFNVGNCWAESVPNYERLANAIYLTEGGNKTSHPYGILAHYRHTTPREACINTCKHKYQEWASNSKSRVSYLEYLASKYAPLNASNDPIGLNKNWLKNVTYFYNKES